MGSAAAAHNSFTSTPYWSNIGTNVQPLTVSKPWTLCGNTTSDISISSCCDNDSDGSITLTNCGSALAINKNDIDINTVED